MNWSQFHEDYMKPQNFETMKNPHIIPKEDGLYLADLPIEPNEHTFQAIKDSVKLKDKVLASKLLFDSAPKNQVPEKNHPYKVDISGYDVSIEVIHLDIAEPFKVAFLTPKIKSIVDHERYYEIEKKENSAHSFTEGSDYKSEEWKKHWRWSTEASKPSVTEESQEAKKLEWIWVKTKADLPNRKHLYEDEQKYVVRILHDDRGSHIEELTEDELWDTSEKEDGGVSYLKEF